MEFEFLEQRAQQARLLGLLHDNKLLAVLNEPAFLVVSLAWSCRPKGFVQAAPCRDTAERAESEKETLEGQAQRGAFS